MASTSSRGKKSAEGVPLAVIKRLPVYHRYLSALAENDIERISSKELAAKIGITASQLRQDLNWFGSFGQQGYGYRVSDLLTEINSILGLDEYFHMIVVGAGNLAKAIITYPNFRRRGFHVESIFDVKNSVVGREIGGVDVAHVRELPSYVENNAVDIGIITTPAHVAQEIADIMVGGGVRAVWNFAPVNLKVPEYVVVENVLIGESLMTLSFRLRQQQSLS